MHGLAEIYVTLTEAAELEGIKRNSMQVRVSRDKDAFVTKIEKSKDGGKDVVLVAVSSLSKSARAGKQRHHRPFINEIPNHQSLVNVVVF